MPRVPKCFASDNKCVHAKEAVRGRSGVLIPFTLNQRISQEAESQGAEGCLRNLKDVSGTRRMSQGAEGCLREPKDVSGNLVFF